MSSTSLGFRESLKRVLNTSKIIEEAQKKKKMETRKENIISILKNGLTQVKQDDTSPFWTINAEIVTQSSLIKAFK